MSELVKFESQTIESQGITQHEIRNLKESSERFAEVFRSYLRIIESNWKWEIGATELAEIEAPIVENENIQIIKEQVPQSTACMISESLPENFSKSHRRESIEIFTIGKIFIPFATKWGIWRLTCITVTQFFLKFNDK